MIPNTDTRPLWSGPRLLVPLTVEALVSTNVESATRFSNEPFKLGNLTAYDNIYPDPFSVQNKLDPGVLLHWALPDGLTHGLADDDTVKYQKLPNRWLIIRYSADNELPFASWMIESDYQGNDRNATGSNYAKYANWENQQFVISEIGNWAKLSDWEETGQSAELFLTAVSNADPSFAAHQGNCPYVFSFNDPITLDSAASCSYVVCGWYSNTEYDILHNSSENILDGWTSKEEWLVLMEHLQWSVGDENDLAKAIAAAQNWMTANGITIDPHQLSDRFPAQTLCHGQIMNVSWPGLSVEPDSNVPSSAGADYYNTPYIAIGNNSIDAFSAFLQYQLEFGAPIQGQEAADQDVGIMLTAFNYQMLNQAGAVLDTPSLEKQIRTAWFGPVPGGYQWEIIISPDRKTENQQQTDTPPAVLAPPVAAKLAELNQAQQNYDAAYRTYVSTQRELYAAWWKYQYFTQSLDPPSGTSEEDLLNALGTQSQVTNNQQDTTNQALADLQTAHDAVTAVLTEEQELKKNMAKPFYQPNDPLALISHVQRSYKRGSDVVFSEEDDHLFVRFTGQFITNIEVAVHPEQSVTVQGLDISPAWADHPHIPKEVKSLLVEACLLDESMAPIIAQNAMSQIGDHSDPSSSFIEAIQQEQNICWNADLHTVLDKHTIEQHSTGLTSQNTDARIPSKVGVWDWKQPWSPLFLAWEVKFYPASNVTDRQLDEWTFNGTDYEFTGTAPSVLEDGPNAFTYQGRSILTPQEAITLSKKLKQFISDYQGDIPDEYTPLKDVITSMHHWDVLSQTLTGLHQLLVQWDLNRNGYIPFDLPNNAEVGNQSEGQPRPDLTENLFFPLRAGFLEITNLYVIDDFGQVMDVIQVVDTSTLGLIPGKGYAPAGYVPNLQMSPFIQLPPRVIQPCRLNFDFISATDDSIRSNQGLDSSPICGWIVPNHLDQALMIYDHTGHLLGEILLLSADSRSIARWMNAPQKDITPETIPNEHLKGFVNGLLQQSSSGQALDDFLVVIDESLWSVDPLGDRSNVNMSILAGYPLALVRGTLQLEGYGSPFNAQGWEQTGQQESGQLLSIDFPVQIGNIELPQDGIMGYFAEGDQFAHFNSVHSGQIGTSTYVTNSYSSLQLNQAPTFTTLLFDPRGKLHFSSGILPVLEVELPEMFVGENLNQMKVEFLVGPVLAQPNRVNIPTPAGMGVAWDWTQATGYSPVDQLISWSAPYAIISNTTPQLSSSPLVIQEGRMIKKMSLGDALAIFFLQINGLSPDLTTDVPSYQVTNGDTIQLSWSSQGGQSASLSDGDTSTDVPLIAAAYSYEVTTSVSLQLTVSDAKGKQQSLTILLNVS